MLVDTRLLGEGRGHFDKLSMRVKLLSCKGQGIEVNSGDKKNGKKMQAEYS